MTDKTNDNTNILDDCDATARGTFKGERLTDLDRESLEAYIGQIPAGYWAEELFMQWNHHADCRTLGDLFSRLYGWKSGGGRYQH